jgi:hypothetical protein
MVPGKVRQKRRRDELNQRKRYIIVNTKTELKISDVFAHGSANMYKKSRLVVWIVKHIM